MSKAKRRFLELLAGDPKPTRFQWVRKPYGEAMKITTRLTDGVRVIGYRTATLAQSEHREIVAAGLVKACSITDLGLAYLAAPEEGE